ncbi:MAG: hypothetical protein ACFFAN_05205, partial [Promethearchaeota archaeon]
MKSKADTFQIVVEVHIIPIPIAMVFKNRSPVITVFIFVFGGSYFFRVKRITYIIERKFNFRLQMGMLFFYAIIFSV